MLAQAISSTRPTAANNTSTAVRAPRPSTMLPQRRRAHREAEILSVRAAAIELRMIGLQPLADGAQLRIGLFDRRGVAEPRDRDHPAHR